MELKLMPAESLGRFLAGSVGFQAPEELKLRLRIMQISGVLIH
jgi:hypothetical protein